MPASAWLYNTINSEKDADKQLSVHVKRSYEWSNLLMKIKSLLNNSGVESASTETKLQDKVKGVT